MSCASQAEILVAVALPTGRRRRGAGVLLRGGQRMLHGLLEEGLQVGGTGGWLSLLRSGRLRRVTLRGR